MIVLLVGPPPEPSVRPAVAVEPPEGLAAALRFSGIMAWRRRREPPLFDEFLSVLMPDPRRPARRRAG